MVLRLIARSPRCAGLDSHRRSRDAGSIFANLTSASGCQDHAPSPSGSNSTRQLRCSVHRIPHPTFVTIAKRPSGWARDGGISAADLPDGTSGIFFAGGLDHPNQLELPREIRIYAHAISPVLGTLDVAFER